MSMGHISVGKLSECPDCKGRIFKLTDFVVFEGTLTKSSGEVHNQMSKLVRCMSCQALLDMNAEQEFITVTIKEEDSEHKPDD